MVDMEHPDIAHFLVCILDICLSVVIPYPMRHFLTRLLTSV